MKHSTKIIFLSAVFILTLGISSTIRQIAAQTKPLTYPEIITALTTKLPNASFKNKSQLINFLIDQIQKRRVDRPLSDSREDDLRQAGANDELIKALRQNSPALSGNTSVPTGAPKSDSTVSNQNIRNKIGMEFVYIPAGTFQMGNALDGPSHSVTLTKAFYMGRTEVTQSQWAAIMESNPSYFKGDNLPVENVSWDDVQEFITILNTKGEGTYRLPTEAEWEYTARAGSTRGYLNDSDSIAWYSANSGGKTHEVATKKANTLGLYDMTGSVWEWTADWYGKYSSRKVTDPKGAGSGSDRVSRGGGWSTDAGFLGLAYRAPTRPWNRTNYLGFRLLKVR